MTALFVPAACPGTCTLTPPAHPRLVTSAKKPLQRGGWLKNAQSVLYIQSIISTHNLVSNKCDFHHTLHVLKYSLRFNTAFEISF